MNTRQTRSSLISHLSSLVLALFVLCCGGERAATTPDDLGRPVAVPPRVARVITLAPNLTELVYAIGAGGKVVGTDDFSNYPAAALRVAKVGGMQPNIEKIAALKPDLVIASTEGNHPNLAPALAAIGVPLFVVRTDRLSQITTAMLRVGELLDAPDAKRAADELQRAIDAQRRTRANAPRILFAVWTDPLYVGGRETFVDDLLGLTGARNAVEVPAWPQYSLETLAATPPDLILYPRKSVNPRQLAALLVRAGGLRVPSQGVDEDVFTRPGPRVGEAAAGLNTILDKVAGE
ncbi:MAG TPA: helical backbone metal receptor [Thermoanaerobaculia bacterium]|jgi:ABC-type Fe3+-hydroxamate transport system substrate-binding protein